MCTREKSYGETATGEGGGWAEHWKEPLIKWSYVFNGSYTGLRQNYQAKNYHYLLEPERMLELKEATSWPTALSNPATGEQKSEGRTRTLPFRIKHHIWPMWASPQTARWDPRLQAWREAGVGGGASRQFKDSPLGPHWGGGSECSELCIKDGEAPSKQTPWRAKAPLCCGSPWPLIFTCREQGTPEAPRHTSYVYICISIIWINHTCAFPAFFFSLPNHQCQHKLKPSGNLFFNVFPIHFICIRDPQPSSVKGRVLGF